MAPVANDLIASLYMSEEPQQWGFPEDVLRAKEHNKIVRSFDNPEGQERAREAHEYWEEEFQRNRSVRTNRMSQAAAALAGIGEPWIPAIGYLDEKDLPELMELPKTKSPAPADVPGPELDKGPIQIFLPETLRNQYDREELRRSIEGADWSYNICERAMSAESAAKFKEDIEREHNILARDEGEALVVVSKGGSYQSRLQAYFPNFDEQQFENSPRSTAHSFPRFRRPVREMISTGKSNSLASSTPIKMSTPSKQTSRKPGIFSLTTPEKSPSSPLRLSSIA